jgi:ethanolamine utilization protein EutA
LRALRKYDLTSFTDGIALAVSLQEPPYTYPYLRALAEAIAGLVIGAESPPTCLFLILDRDTAKTIGSILREELAFVPDIVAIDGIDLGDLNYVDIGRPMGASEVLPVTVKSLVFPNRSECSRSHRCHVGCRCYIVVHSSELRNTISATR